jgi:hypothetical protein
MSKTVKKTTWGEIRLNHAVLKIYTLRLFYFASNEYFGMQGQELCLTFITEEISLIAGL